MECNSKMCMDNRHATMDPRSPNNNMYSSITDLSEFSSRSSSRYQGKENLCPMSENRRVPSMTVGSTSNSGPDLSGYATDDGPVITERKKKNTLFGDATDDGSMVAELERKIAAEIEGKMAAETERIRGLLHLNGIEELERQRKILRGESTEDGSIEAEVERKRAILFSDAGDDWSTRPEIERKIAAKIKSKMAERNLFGRANDDMSIITDRRNNTLVGDDGSTRARIDRTNNNLLGDAAEDESEPVISERNKSAPCVDAIDDESIIVERRRKKKKKKEEGRTKWGEFWIIPFLLMVEFILPWFFSGLFEPCLTADELKYISKESMASRRLSDRLDFVVRKLSSIVPGQVVNCTGSDSAWKLRQDGLLVYSCCTLYSSMVEEVSLLGFPSQTAGVMGRRITDRSFTIMSGRMIEWYEGKTDYAVHQEGGSWTHEMLTASVVQMDEKTWILEYRPSVILQGGGSVSWALRCLKWRTHRICERLRLNYRSFLMPMLGVPQNHGDLRTPT